MKTKTYYHDLDINARINWKASLKYSGLMSNNFFKDRGFLREVCPNHYGKLIV